MKEIQLKGSTQLICLVSDEDYDSLNEYNWRLNRNSVYAIIDGKHVRMAHFIMGKPKHGLIVDHINCNNLDNRRENLRVVTISYSNQKTRKNKKSRYTGIYYNDKKRLWRVYCKKHYLGSYRDELEAAKLYDKAAYVLFGEHAKTNKLITYLDTKDLTIEDLIVIKVRKLKLPDNITYRKHNNKYEVRLDYNNKVYRKTYISTLDEAIMYKEQLSREIEKEKARELDNHYTSEIERNKDGVAVIKRKDFEILIDDDLWYEYSCKSWALSDGYAKTNSENTTVFMHRLIMGITETNVNMIVDHINRNRLDNRRANLRIVSTLVNAHNKTKRINTSSKYIGVSKNIRKRKWEVSIRHNNKKYHIGMFLDEIEAAKAYNRKAEELYGSEANVNVLDE
jgi:hypothetical protein